MRGVYTLKSFTDKPCESTMAMKLREAKVRFRQVKPWPRHKGPVGMRIDVSTGFATAFVRKEVNA